MIAVYGLADFGFDYTNKTGQVGSCNFLVDGRMMQLFTSNLVFIKTAVVRLVHGRAVSGHCSPSTPSAYVC